MKLIYNVVINSHVDTVWKLLTNLENQEIFIDILSIEKSSLNTYVFHFKNKFKTNSYHTLLLDKKDSRKLSFCMVNKNFKVTKTLPKLILRQ